VEFRVLTESTYINQVAMCAKSQW